MRWTVVLMILFFMSSGQAAPDSVIARQVESAPKVQSEEELTSLVTHLTKNLKKEEDKAYALLTWIVQNIDYDEYKSDQIEKKVAVRRSRGEIPQDQDILKTRLGVCEDIANLYQKMLQIAGMKATLITGCVGEIDKKAQKCKDHQPGHAWNAVWINNQWELVDPTWAITGKQVTAMENVGRKTTYERALKKRERKSAQTYDTRTGRNVNKKWFMTAPKVMEEDHHPMDEKWLLTKTRDRRNINL